MLCTAGDSSALLHYSVTGQSDVAELLLSVSEAFMVGRRDMAWYRTGCHWQLLDLRLCLPPFGPIAFHPN